MNFDNAFELVIGVEQGYVNDPHDPGGETKYGISKRCYPKLNIKLLTLEQAKRMMYDDYWMHCACDKLGNAALVVFDCAVNQGQPTAISLLQQAVHVHPDGDLGAVTLTALARIDPNELAARIAALRMVHYGDTPNWDRNKNGWSLRLMHMLVAAVTPQPSQQGASA